MGQLTHLPHSYPILGACHAEPSPLDLGPDYVLKICTIEAQCDSRAGQASPRHAAVEEFAREGPHPMKRFLVALGLAALVLIPLTPTASWAKEFEIDGTIDCGVPSGQPCLPIKPAIGILTDQISGKMERVDVVIGLLLQQKLSKSKVGQSLLDDPLGVNRAALFSQMKPILDRLAEFNTALQNPDSMSPQEKERIADQLFDRGLDRELAAARDKIILITQNFAQDARVRITVTDELGPALGLPPGVLVATGVVAYHDYQMSQSRSSGTLNLGQLTGDDSESFFCTDFVEEALDFAKERIIEEGKLQLTDNEELFFELISELPNPCLNRIPEIKETVANWIIWNLKATRDQLSKQLKPKEINRLEVFRRILENPVARQKFFEFLKDTILKPRPDGRRPFKFLLEDRKR